MIYLDTHLILWLYAGSVDLISKEALRLVDQHDLYISPMVELELQFLKESQKIKKSPREILEALHKDINLKVCSKDFQSIVSESTRMHWTRDPFDRIIVAHAALNDNIILTKDTSIHDHYKKAVW